MDPRELAAILGDWGYAALLALLLATGVLSPIPEDLLLVAAGYLVSAGIFSWARTLPLCLVGVVASDVLLYWWGTRIRRGVGSRWAGQVVRSERLARAGAWFDRFGDRAVFVARLVPGTRAVAFVGAGLRGIPLRRFLLYDTLGALLWVPLLTALGSQLGEEVGGLDRLISRVTRIGGWVVLAVLVLAVAWLLRRGEESKL